MYGSRTLGMLAAAVLIGAGTVLAAPTPPTEGRTDLALGKTVLFSPAPNYSLTKKGDTDATDLTDGKLGKRPDHRLWFESGAVGWSYAGRVNLAVDLGKLCDIDEVAIRFQNNGSPNGGMDFPGWVEVFVSQDGEHYTKAGEFSRWNQGAFKKFGIPQERGESDVQALRFQHLNTQARWVGLRFYANGLSVSDELYVFGKPANGKADAKDADSRSGAPSGFTVKHPQFFFNKPYVEVATNAPLPAPIGLDLPAGKETAVTLSVEAPPGLEIVGGNVGQVKVESVTPMKGKDEGWRKYTFSDKTGKSNKVFGRLYLQAKSWKDGQQGELRYQFGQADQWESPLLSIPVKAVKVKEAPRLKKIMASLGWWNGATTPWPDQLKAYRVIGFNTFNTFGMWMPDDPKDPAWAMLEKARKEGFFISNIDSPLGPIIKRHRSAKEIYDQFQDGTVGKKLCISYRGKYYQEEINRFATMMAKIRPDFSSEDIELWGWRGPTDSMDCSRCQADFQTSGFGSWAQWQQSKGKEMIHDLITAAQKAVAAAGGKPFSTGCYDFRPGHVYQQLFNFDQLYPELLQTSQVSTYSSLQPGDLCLVGDEARRDRSKLRKSDVMPWISPGDAGVFPGEAFQWALLENYANGARGVWFWSSRVWDSEDMIAYNRVIRAIAPVEDLILNGELVGAQASVVGEGRVSGIQSKGHMMLLVADYFGKTNGSVQLSLNLPGQSKLRDLLSGKSLDQKLSAGRQSVTIPLNGQRARLLEVVPD